MEVAVDVVAKEAVAVAVVAAHMLTCTEPGFGFGVDWRSSFFAPVRYSVMLSWREFSPTAFSCSCTCFNSACFPAAPPPPPPPPPPPGWTHDVCPWALW